MAVLFVSVMILDDKIDLFSYKNHDSRYKKRILLFFYFSNIYKLQIMSEKRNRSSLTLEAKQFLIAEKEKQPTISIRQLTTDLFLKFNIKTSKSVVFRTLKAKEELKEIRMDSKAIKNRKYMMNKGRLEFEKVLDRNLRTKFVKRKSTNLGI